MSCCTDIHQRSVSLQKSKVVISFEQVLLLDSQVWAKMKMKTGQLNFISLAPEWTPDQAIASLLDSFC